MSWHRAAGVRFPAARRKSRSTHFCRQNGPAKVWNAGLGGPPKPARGPRALPTSEFRLNRRAYDRFGERETAEDGEVVYSRPASFIAASVREWTWSFS